MKRYLWVVEMEEPKGFMPTVGVSLSRAAGRVELEEWKGYNPSDKFRLVKYIPNDSRKSC